MKEKSAKKVTKATEEAVTEAKVTEPVKAEEKETIVKAEEKAPAKKETKTRTTKTASRSTAPKASRTTKDTKDTKETAKKAAPRKAAAKKEEVKASVTLQFDGKAYTEKELTIIAKDVWKYDLQKDEADINTIELYVKPEEGVCYYVFNGEITGSFKV